MDQWENDLANDVFSIEEEVEGSLIALEDNQAQVNTAGAEMVLKKSVVMQVTQVKKPRVTGHAVTGQAGGSNTLSSSQVQTSPSLDLTVTENHASKTFTSHSNAQLASQMSGEASVFNLAPKSELENAAHLTPGSMILLSFRRPSLQVRHRKCHNSQCAFQVRN